MKKVLCLVLAVVFVLALLTACGTNTPAPSTAPSAAPSAAPTAAPSNPDTPDTPDAPDAPDSGLPYAVDELGIAMEPYEYELPLTDSDTVITYWITNYNSQNLPPDKTYGETDLPVADKNLTGVNVEYVLLPPQSRAENFSVLLAADNLCDIMTNASMYYPGPITAMFDQGYAVNIYDYKEYMPNYLYQAKYAYPDDVATYESVFYEDTFVPFADFLTKDLHVTDMGYCIRQDFLDKVGLKADDVITWDQLEEALTLIKTNIDSVEFPMWIAGTLESTGYWQFGSFGTTAQIVSISLPPVYLNQGKVKMGCTNDADRQLCEELNKFYSEGLINPDWAGYIYAALFSPRTYNNEVGYQSMSASGINESNALCVDPNCNWVPIQKPLVTEDQVMHVGSILGRTSAGNCAFAAKNNDLELAMKWVDWRYSEAGWPLYTYGPEGLCCEKDASGNWKNTDWALNNPDGISLSGLLGIYTIGSLVEPGMARNDVAFLNANGDIARAAIESWTSWLNKHYDAADAYPIGCRLSIEQDEEIGKYRADIITYIVENFTSFICGDRPMSEWADYEAQLANMGLNDILAVYQECYDDYMASK